MHSKYGENVPVGDVVFIIIIALRDVRFDAGNLSQLLQVPADELIDHFALLFPEDPRNLMVLLIVQSLAQREPEEIG